MSRSAKPQLNVTPVSRHFPACQRHTCATPQQRETCDFRAYFMDGLCARPTECLTSRSNSLYVPLPMIGVVTTGPPAEEFLQERGAPIEVFFPSKRTGHVELRNQSLWFSASRELGMASCRATACLLRRHGGEGVGGWWWWWWWFCCVLTDTRVCAGRVA